MKSRPILMSSPMVRALLAGTKTQTRRVVKPQPVDPYTGRDLAAGARPESLPRCPYGEPGDGLWVRETWAPCEAPARRGHFHYAADGAVGHRWQDNGGDGGWSRSGHTLGFADKDLMGVWVGKPARWKPSIFMPREASRLTLRVMEVRVERLQGISEADAVAEGVEPVDGGWRVYDEESPPWLAADPRFSYRSLWESINGPGSWAANPWVWVVLFEVLR